MKTSIKKSIKKSIGEILWLSNLSSNPGYYASRNIDYGDISAEKICEVSKNILQYLGPEEQQVFNRMVLDLPVLTGSVFVEYTVRLQVIGREEGWWWDKEIIFNHYNQDLLKMPICQKTEKIKETFKKLMNL